jgi:hypothetical protein
LGCRPLHSGRGQVYAAQGIREGMTMVMPGWAEGPGVNTRNLGERHVDSTAPLRCNQLHRDLE